MHVYVFSKSWDHKSVCACVCVCLVRACVCTRGRRVGGERHGELCAEELQPLLLDGQRPDLLLQTLVLHLQLVQGLEHGHH